MQETLEVDDIDAIKSRFDETPRLNSSSHSHYAKYMDDEPGELIGRKDSELIEKYGYALCGSKQQRPGSHPSDC